MMNEFAMQLLSTLKNADESYLADVFQALERGNRKAELSEKPKKEKTVKKKEKEDLPEASSGAPDASAYRMPAASIDISTCVARITKDGEDKRWSPAVYRERQCGKDVTENGLCKTCSARAEKYEGKAGAWLGRVTEEPLEWIHMLGTEWAAKKNPVFKDADAESVGIVSAQEMKEEPAEVEVKVKEVKEVKEVKAKKVAKPKPSEEEKAAAKAAKEAEKEAAKAAAKAAKEAEKAAAKAAKEAEKPKKAEKKPKKAEKAEKAEEVKVVEAAVEEVTGEMRIIEDVVYFIRNGNVYNYSELDEEIGNFVGRLTEAGTIDTEADEVTAAESESD